LGKHPDPTRLHTDRLCHFCNRRRHRNFLLLLLLLLVIAVILAALLIVVIIVIIVIVVVAVAHTHAWIAAHPVLTIVFSKAVIAAAGLVVPIVATAAAHCTPDVKFILVVTCIRVHLGNCTTQAGGHHTPNTPVVLPKV
jgi:hypothetical protein